LQGGGRRFEPGTLHCRKKSGASRAMTISCGSGSPEQVHEPMPANPASAAAAFLPQSHVFLTMEDRMADDEPVIYRNEVPGLASRRDPWRADRDLSQTPA
jgi:hypothetical protein